MSEYNEIINLIEDIKADQESLKKLEDEISKAKIELENLEDDHECTKADIKRNREKVEDLIDEATGRDDTQRNPFGDLYQR